MDTDADFYSLFLFLESYTCKEGYNSWIRSYLSWKEREIWNPFGGTVTSSSRSRNEWREWIPVQRDKQRWRELEYSVSFDEHGCWFNRIWTSSVWISGYFSNNLDLLSRIIITSIKDLLVFSLRMESNRESESDNFYCFKKYLELNTSRFVLCKS